MHDPKSDLAATRRKMSEQATRTKTGNPLPDVFYPPHGSFQNIFDDLVEGFDVTKSTGFENRTRQGNREAWIDGAVSRDTTSNTLRTLKP